MVRSATERGWGNPDSARFSRNIVSVTAGGIDVAVHQGVADVFRYLLTVLARTYDLAGYADDWGYANRDVRGHPGVKSNHSWGLAVDLDATKNPMTTNLKATHELVRAVIDPILAPFEGRLLWGGEYASPRKDYMHFEYVGTPTSAISDSYRARRLLLAGQPGTTQEDVMSPAQEKKLDRVIDLLEQLVAPRRPDHKDTNPAAISLGDVLNKIEEKQ